MHQTYFKTKQAADVLGVSAVSLEKWRQRGIGPEFQKFGIRTVRYHIDALTEYQTNSTVKPVR